MTGPSLHPPSVTPTATARSGPLTGERRLPGDIDMWVMILGDLFFFGCYFIIYMIFRAQSVQQFTAAQQHLNVGIGVINTVVLLTSSAFAARAVTAVRAAALDQARRLLWAAAACGVLFIVVKAYEWHDELSHGHTISNGFFSFYYVFTGLHLVHLALGLLILGVALRELANPNKRRPGIVEQSVLFWHMIDLLWVVIFALLYLMR
jgi:nitric oxide reductase NorE protein